MDRKKREKAAAFKMRKEGPEGKRAGLHLKKKLFAGFLCMVMAFSGILAPGPGWNAFGQEASPEEGGDGKTAETITVYMTVFLKGEPALTAQGELALMLPVELKEPATMEDALRQAHESYCETGGEGFDCVSGFVTRLWGQDSYSLGFYRNDSQTDLVSGEKVERGDQLVAFSYQDEALWTDRYAYFDTRQAQVNAGESLSLSLMTKQGGYEGAQIFLSEGTTLQSTQVTSGTGGRVSLPPFTQEGSWYVLAVDSQGPIVPAVCRVEVEGSYSQEEIEAIVSRDAQALTLPEEAGKDLDLPRQGESGKTSITWTSSQPSVITEQGKVYPGACACQVTLTALIQWGDIQEEKRFSVTVLPLAEEEVQTLLSEAASLVEGRIFTLQEWEDENGGTNNGENRRDENLISVVEEIVHGSYPQVKVTLSESRIPQILENGQILYQEEPLETGAEGVIFRLGLAGLPSEEEIEAEAGVYIPAHEKTKEEVLALAAQALTFEEIRMNNTDPAHVTGDLNLTGISAESYAIGIEWESDRPEIISDYGSVTRPGFGQEDAVVNLTATIYIEALWISYGMAPPGPAAEPVSVSFSLTVPAVSQEELTEIKEEVDQALSRITPESFRAAGVQGEEEEIPDLSALTWDLQLVDAQGKIQTQWSSDNEEALKVNYLRAKVTRPGPGEEDARANLTVTLSLGGYSAQKTFPVVIKSVTEEEIRREEAFMEKVAQSLFEGICLENENPLEITSDLDVVYRAIEEEEGIRWEYKNTGERGIEISHWESSAPEVLNSYGQITRPEKDTPVTYTAKLSSIRLGEYVKERTVGLALVVLSDRMERIEGILEEIQRDWLEKEDEALALDPWKLMDLGAYELYGAGEASRLDLQARQAYVNQAVEALSQVSAPSQASEGAKHVLALRALGYSVTDLKDREGGKIDAIALLAKMDPEKLSPSALSYVWMALQQEPQRLTEELTQTYVTLLKAQFDEDGLVRVAGEANAADTTAANLAALAFCREESDPWQIEALIEKSLRALSGLQGEDGSYGTANADAMVLLALCGLGEDPEGELFTKEKGDLVSGLLSYCLEEKAGFGMSDGQKENELATEQAFRALTGFWVSRQKQDAFLLYDFTANERNQTGYASLTEGDSKPGGQGSGGSSGTRDPQQDTVSVYFTLWGDAVHGEEAHSGGWPVWIPKTSVTVEADATVYDVFTQALDERGYSYQGAERGYVSQITTPEGTSLGQLDNGPYSGWVFAVNGALCQVSLTEMQVEEGDQILWYYTDDFTKEEGFSQMEEGDTPPGQPGEEGFPEGAPSEMPGEGTLTETEKALLSAFEDLRPEAWYAGAVAFVLKEGLFAGVGQTTFSPDGPMTRAMAAVVLFRMEEGASSGYTKSGFWDVPEDAWYAPAIDWAARQGILAGYEDGSAGPDENITREQLASILYRYAQYKGYDTAQGGMAIREFTDYESISDYAMEAMAWAVNADIINGMGDGALNPQGDATRAQVAQMLMSFSENVVK